MRLLALMEYIFAPVTTDDKTRYMELLIEDFLSDFVDLYPERPLIPKMHYLVHMPMWIRRYALVLLTYIYSEIMCLFIHVSDVGLMVHAL